jgi:hypothetical protein
VVRTAEVLEMARRQSGLTVTELWFAYIVLGGTGSVLDVGDYLAGSAEPSAHQYDVLAQALNDEFVHQGGNHPVPYADERNEGQVRPRFGGG